MKKLFTLFAAALVMLTAASCEKNEVLPGNNSEGKVVTLKASINNGETRTSLGAKVDDIYPVLWSAGDAISVIQGSSAYTFVLSPECAGETSGTFMYLAELAPSFNPEENYTAFYPANSVSVNDVDGTVQYTILGTQYYAENSFGSGAMPMAATSTGGTSFIFNNLFGVLKLQLKGAANEKVTSIVITSSNALNGEAQLVEGAIALRGEAAENKKVTLDCSADGGVALNQDEATDFHIALPANATGLKVLINTNKGSFYKEVPNQNGEITNEIKAGKILKMPELNTKNMAPAYIENGVYYGDGVKLPKSATETIIWAPVNCGYEPVDGSYKGYPYGKLYQWGRKYGQGYDSNDDSYPTGESLVNAFVSLEQGQSKENENIFYKVSSSTDNDWLNNPNNQLWNSGNEDFPVKTDYDPCPDGWRVPTKSELTSLKEGFIIKDGTFNNQKGAWFYGMIDGDPTESSSKLFLPFAGKRDKWGQSASQRNNEGYYWSSSVEYNQAFKMDFGSSYIAINAMARVYGFSVRCVKDVPQSEPVPSSN